MADSEFTGQTLDDDGALPGQYIKHPPAASSHFRDGKPLSANVAMRLQQNLSVLTRENLRHLFVWTYGGAKYQVDGWSGLVDGTNPNTTWSTIAWDDRTARRFGPLFGVEDRRTNDGTPALREVTIEAYCKSGAANSLTLYFAITTGQDPTMPYDGTAAAIATIAGTSAGLKSETLSVPLAIGATPVTARPAAQSTRGLAVATVPHYWVWVGWRSTNVGDKIYSVSAYESR